MVKTVEALAVYYYYTVCYIALDIFLKGIGPGSIRTRATLLGEKKN